jgi:hypothetical protein
MTAPVDGGSITYITGVDSKTQSGFVPLFDPRLGRLQEVDFSANGSGTALTAVFPPIGPGEYRYVYRTEFDFLVPLGGFGPILSTNFGTGFLDVPMSSVESSTPFNVSETFTVGIGSFYGTGLANLTLNQFTSILDAQNQSGITLASGVATVTYVYTAPEPSSLLLICLGLLTVAGYPIRGRP